jgi:hypothetical protein
MSPGVRLDNVEKGNMPGHCQESNHNSSAIQTVPSSFTVPHTFIWCTNIHGNNQKCIKFVVGQPSDLDAKGMKTAVQQRNVKENVRFNSLGIWSSGAL